VTEKYLKSTLMYGKNAEIYGFWTLDLRVCAKILRSPRGLVLPRRLPILLREALRSTSFAEIIFGRITGLTGFVLDADFAGFADFFKLLSTFAW